ncbi:ABC transporter permease [Chelatococcus reniformis]|uniref:ABC transporter permease n=1 Tax=Chelatococcus reniformis TaxID=1494448 RepID=A0A916XI77_9HYPH|nr:ABC transporter permease [Chelatococcus reniformis]GGC72332.1 ABC transporter permease [Chelatococcus reniformis]
MARYLVQRLLLALGVIVFVSALTFALTEATVDPALAVAGEGATEEAIQQIRRQYGFDRPLVERYLGWLGGIASGDLGESYRMRRPVADIIGEHLPVTLKLGFLSLAFAILVAIPLGVLAAVRQNTWIDRFALSVSVIGQALPNFLFALLLIIVFGVNLRWLPISGSGTWQHFVMPTIALGYYAMPALMRLTRSGMIEALEADYVRTALAKGLSPGTVVFRHALQNAILPVVSLGAVQFGFMLGGSVIIEVVFGLNGLGYLARESIRRADLPVVQSIVLLISFFYVVLILLADVLNGLLDPRIRSTGA